MCIVEATLRAQTKKAGVNSILSYGYAGNIG